MPYTRINISSNTKWEDIVGYSRLVKVGNHIKVAGTTATNGSNIIAPNQAYEQTCYIIEKIAAALQKVSANLSDVVCTRLYVTNISRDWEAIGKAHGKYFKDIKPVATMVEVKSLIDPSLVVEIEVEAIIIA
jgi:enamine deaminase RidA (YjgF/YER057c/UK114 family)